eukprot:TRINITY_DN7599_c0_g1_i2.p1 TRINITY_DN7599_c0_g1~~TRINITY_DN7599_c0_g1_i2.p1  ORF type:complete len:301 (-),score=54.52 TRINITY_DN7599_c0_g1_i2:268-1170(-)
MNLRARLLEIAKTDSEFDSVIANPKLGLLDLILDYKVRLSLDALIEVTTRIGPRFFTICSSELAHPNSAHIVASMLKEKTTPTRIKEGLCSQYFEALMAQHRAGKPQFCRIKIRESSFVLPEDPSRPILMVGAGTGLAPFRAILQQKQVESQGLLDQKCVSCSCFSTSNIDPGEKATLGPLYLVFGCRKYNSDFIYRDEIETYRNQGVLSKLLLALSRENEAQKMYVQNVLDQEYDFVVDVVFKQDAYVFICGATTMGNEVVAVLEKHYTKYANVSADDAKAYFVEKEARKGLIKELWGY